MGLLCLSTTKTRSGMGHWGGMWRKKKGKGGLEILQGSKLLIINDPVKKKSKGRWWTPQKKRKASSDGGESWGGFFPRDRRQKEKRKKMGAPWVTAAQDHIFC